MQISNYLVINTEQPVYNVQNSLILAQKQRKFGIFFNNVSLTDECHFQQSGHINKHDMHFCVSE